MFHMDEVLSAENPLPKQFIVLKVPSYDGAQYYQIARNIPKIFEPAAWQELRTKSPGPYAYQRFLLPLAAYVLSAGNENALPWAFLFINSIAILGTCFVVLRWGKNAWFYSIAVCLSPAMVVALHFMLAEPLNIILIAFFLTRYCRQERMDTINILLLALCVLTREITIVFVLGCMAYSLWKKRWIDAMVLLIPVAVFISLHTLIYLIFKQIPFLWSAEKNDWPLHAISALLTGQGGGYNAYTLSSIALFLLFVIPAILSTALTMLKKRKITFIPYMLFSFLVLMLAMPDHIWGSITSIGRVITPVYPLFIHYAVSEDQWIHRTIAGGWFAIGIVTTLGLAFSLHPYIIT